MADLSPAQLHDAIARLRDILPSEPTSRTVKVLLGPPANTDTAPPQSKLMKFLMSSPADTFGSK